MKLHTDNVNISLSKSIAYLVDTPPPSSSFFVFRYTGPMMKNYPSSEHLKHLEHFLRKEPVLYLSTNTAHREYTYFVIQFKDLWSGAAKRER